MKSFVKCLIVLAFVFGFLTTPVLSKDICVHGHSGRLQTPDKEDRSINPRTGKTTSIYHRWGLDIEMPRSDEPFDWVHFSIPVNTSDVYRYVILYYYGEWWPEIIGFDVWSGALLIKSFNFKYISYTAHREWTQIAFELRPDTRFPFGAAGISIKIQPDSDGYYPWSRLIIHSVCLSTDSKGAQIMR